MADNFFVPDSQPDRPVRESRPEVIVIEDSDSDDGVLETGIQAPATTTSSRVLINVDPDLDDRPVFGEPARTSVIELEPPPVITREFGTLRQRMPFRDFKDLLAFTRDNEELTARLLRALSPPASADEPVARFWLAEVRKVVPGEPTALAAHLNQPATAWRVISKALNLKDADAIGVLAELHWTRNRDGRVLDVEYNKLRAMLQLAKVRDAFDERFDLLRALEWLPAPDQVSTQLAPMTKDGYPRYMQARKAAVTRLESRMKSRREQLLADQTREEWLKSLATAPGLKEERALDRVADVITSFNGSRVCVALMHSDREIGVFANHPDGDMGKDLEALLRASRAVGQDAENQVRALVARIQARDRTSKQKKQKQQLARSVQRADIRVRKAIAHLRTLEERHGRIRVVAYNSPLPTSASGRPMEVHAEMQALAVALAHPTGAKLGVGRLCCFKCWLVLTDVYPGVFRRTLATHMNAYPWPTPSFLRDRGALRRLFGEDPPPDVRDALDSDRIGWGALASAFFGATAVNDADGTGYASSQESPSPLPVAPTWVDTDDEEAEPPVEEAPPPAETLDAFDAYLDADDADDADERPAPEEDRGEPRPTDAPTLTPFTKVKRPSSPHPPTTTTTTTNPIHTGIPRTPSTIAPRTPPKPKSPGVSPRLPDSSPDTHTPPGRGSKSQPRRRPKKKT
ncbi:hypothetical protein [Acrocarpospora phusangensis]|nr:hypothetical protein [Acrocarpospora phusangensis]